MVGLDLKEVRKWTQIAAENGHGNGAGLMAADYEESGGKKNCLRAKLWFERAGAMVASRGRRIEQTILGNLETLADHWEECVKRGATPDGSQM